MSITPLKERALKTNLSKFAIASVLFVIVACSGSEPASDANDAIEMPLASSSDASSAINAPQLEPISDPFTIVMLGDSLTAGFGLPPSQALPAEIERILKSAGNAINLINAGVSGDTSAGGLARYDWSVASADPDMLILALGANDYLGGVDPDQTRKNLAAIVERALADDLEILLVSVSARSSADSDPRAAVFSEIYPDLAETYEIALYPGLVDPIYNQPDLLMQDGLHPNAEGVRTIAIPLSETIVAFLNSD